MTSRRKQRREKQRFQVELESSLVSQGNGEQLDWELFVEQQDQEDFVDDWDDYDYCGDYSDGGYDDPRGYWDAYDDPYYDHYDDSDGQGYHGPYLERQLAKANAEIEELKKQIAYQDEVIRMLFP